VRTLLALLIAAVAGTACRPGAAPDPASTVAAPSPEVTASPVTPTATATPASSALPDPAGAALQSAPSPGPAPPLPGGEGAASGAASPPISSSPPPAPAASPPPSPQPSPPPAPQPAPAVPTPIATPVIREAVALDPTGPAPLSLTDETVVDPAATFRVEVAHALPDGRLVLLDGSQAILPSRGTREVGPAATTFTLVPADPLVPASRYLLRLEGVSGRDLHDGAGAAYGPVAATILVAGTPPEPPPKATPKRRRARR
jgi:hypothetical protein